MRIQNNIMAINTHRQLGINQLNQSKSTEKLSSGYRINRAADDAAGLSISEKMRSQIRGLGRASMNAQDGISLIQAAEGALQESQSILQRMRELAVQAASGVPAKEDRDAILSELEQLGQELERIASTTNFNGKYVLSGVYGGEEQGDIKLQEENLSDMQDRGVLPEEQEVINLQVGSNTNIGDVITLRILGVSRMDLLGGVDEYSYGLQFGFKGDDFPVGFEDSLREDSSTGQLLTAEAVPDESASPANEDSFWQGLMNILTGNLNMDGTVIEDGPAAYTGLARISFLRGELGAIQNRLEHTVANLDTVAENVQAAESRIRDVDMAKEMMAFTKNNILNQAATAMLAQANQTPQTVLQLLQ
ncbi:MAG: flagellin [Oscillospiraceae bacterium]|jgi:flagellin|nr:flagellin [Oscillospiraceae bacterium]